MAGEHGTKFRTICRQEVELVTIFLLTSFVVVSRPASKHRDDDQNHEIFWKQVVWMMIQEERDHGQTECRAMSRGHGTF